MEGKTDKAIEFLQKFYPKGPWHLTSISTDKKGVNTKVFGPKSVPACVKFIDSHNGTDNLYFTVNRPSTSFLRSEHMRKAKKEHMFEAQWLYLDVDPAEGQEIEDERERILGQLTDKRPKGIPEPTVLIFSGGGFQAFWKLKQPFVIDGTEANWDEYELYNKRLEQIFGGDHCHNVDRIMRLPGTVNIPDAKKRKKGRVEIVSSLLQFNNNIYDLDEFKKAAAVQTTGGGRDIGAGAKVNIPGNVVRIEDLSELDEWDVPDRLKVVVAQGSHPDQPKEGDNSRSAWLFDCVCGLTRHGVPDEVIFSLLTDPDWHISDSVLELKGGAERYAIRQIGRAKEYSQDPKLTEMNDQFAVIGNIGGKCRVIEEVPNELLNRTSITYSSFEDLRNRFSNKLVKVGTTKDGAEVTKPLGKYWLDHPMRRQYDTIRFMPNSEKEGVYNLWRGFSVESTPGDCSIFLDHVLNNICGGNEEHYDYVLKWMARAIQQPASQGEVAIVLRGGKGTGKGTFASTFGRLFGRHHMHVANANHLVGQFNAHLQDCVSLFADEAFFAGDKKHESVLKMLVTEDTIPVEKKGVDLETCPNFVHLIMASNDSHVVRASGDERRFLILDMSNRRQQDTSYFHDLREQMDNGGYEALLYFLQDIDLTTFNVREVPQTDALNEQKLLSMSQEEEWWWQKLMDGRLLDNHTEWKRYVASKDLEGDFTNYADTWKFSRRGNATQLGRFLFRVAPHLEKTQRRIEYEYQDANGYETTGTKRAYVYNFGSLEKCRAVWDELYGEQQWSEPVQLELKDKEMPF